MTKFIALLRGVNVGGHRKVPMAELREVLTELGYREVSTLLASGNFVFEAKSAKPPALEKKLEAELAKTLGLETDIMVRDPKEWDAVIDANPFVKEAAATPARVLVMVLKTKPSADAVKKTIAGNRGPELLHVHQREAYVFYPNGQGTSKLNLKALGSGTGRNWNTVLKLKELVG
jgi:uncharacterized protein (DUF1697 family)